MIGDDLSSQIRDRLHPLARQVFRPLALGGFREVDGCAYGGVEGRYGLQRWSWIHGLSRFDCLFSET